MTRKADGQGGQPWPSEAIYIRRDANGIPIVPHRVDDRATMRFGRPSSYSLTKRELTAHVRALRRQGWASWEIRTRFDFKTVA